MLISSAKLIPELNSNSIPPGNCLQNEDILFAAKGERNFAWLYTPEIGAAVASSSFLVLRLKPAVRESLLPEFLVWQLNDLATQRQFRALARGSSLPSITKQAFAALEVRIPAPAIQRQILQLQTFWNAEKALLHQLTEKKEILYLHLMRKLLRDQPAEESNESYPTGN